MAVGRGAAGVLPNARRSPPSRGPAGIACPAELYYRRSRGAARWTARVRGRPGQGHRLDESASPQEGADRETASSQLKRNALAQALQDIRPRLRALALSRGVPHDDVDDLLQDAFTKVLERLDRTEIEHPKKYLQTTVERLAADWHRSPYNHRRVHIGPTDGDDETGGDIERLQARYDYVRSNRAEQLDRAECIDRVLDAIQQTHPLHYRALELAFEGVSGRKMAGPLNRSPAAANQFLSTARELLQRLLETKCGEDFNRD